MIAFEQTVERFFVDEILFYEPSGHGRHVFARICKKGMSTGALERQVSAQTGVPIKQMRHAGMKDRLATTRQWLSWPADLERDKPFDTDDFSIESLNFHENGLSIGHILSNRFELILEHNGSVDPAALAEFTAKRPCFPNFFGRQRFGRAIPDLDEAAQLLARPVRSKMTVSMLQSLYFNLFLQKRLATHGAVSVPGDLWTRDNGKRWFLPEDMVETEARFAAGEITPTGPVFGYKMAWPEHDEESVFAAEHGLTPEKFRPWGKIAKGTRRPLFVFPADVLVEKHDEKSIKLAFSLPSGSYATVYLSWLFMSDCLMGPMSEWPDFTRNVVLQGA